MSSGSLIKKDFFILLKSAIHAINPAVLINKNLELKTDDYNDYLSISNRISFSGREIFKTDLLKQHQQIQLKKNVYVLAFGKAALGNS